MTIRGPETAWYVVRIPVQETECLSLGVTLAQDCEGSALGGLEESSPLRVLDAPNQDGRPRRGHSPCITPQFTPWRMVPSNTRFILAHHGIQHSLRRPILLPTFEEYLYFHVTIVDPFWDPPRYPAIRRLDCRRFAHVNPPIPMCRQYDAPGGYKRPPLLRRFAFRAVTHEVHPIGPVVGRSDYPSDPASQPPWLACRRSSAELLCFIFAPRLPAPRGLDTWRR